MLTEDPGRHFSLVIWHRVGNQLVNRGNNRLPV